MKEYVNFYESLKEARMRLENTVVLYDGVPHYILTVCDHMEDGIFRVYMEKLGENAKMAIVKYEVPYSWHDDGHTTRGAKMDKFMEANPKSGVIRKMMNSPLFNKFRPFPLGMVNLRGSVVYAERSPNRSTYQGLTQNMISAIGCNIATAMSKGSSGLRGLSTSIALLSDELADTIIGNYPTFEECLFRLREPKILNEGAAFDRNFALMRGPLDLFFIAYRGDIIGYLPNGDASSLVIGKSYEYTREVVQDLKLFKFVTVR